MRDQLAVTHQIHTGVFVADGTVEVELIYTWMLAGEKPLLDVVAVLVVVDGDTEGNGLAGWGEIVAQTHGEGYFGCAARRGRTAYSTWMGKKKNNYTNRSFSLQFLNSSICGVVDNRQLLQKIKRENLYFYNSVSTDLLWSNVSERMLGHQLTIIPPWAEVKGRNVLALGVTGAPRPELEGFLRHFGDASVVANNPGK